ncbi:sensor histidine kinase [Flaviflexus massiliensis]|uniref:sensor histidine kinase n=1 Tax=Flaviflexus massiliensis TaxID=1522309 RepID=UPI0006D57B86|nr:histidine kinase [Flaviflexus massiliensis]
MAHSNLAPVFTGLRYGLHTLVTGLLIFVIAQAFAQDRDLKWWVLIIAVIFLGTYVSASFAPRRNATSTPSTDVPKNLSKSSTPQVLATGSGTSWILALTGEWALLTWLSPEAAFIVFPMFFLYIHLIPGIGGGIAIILATLFAIVALGLHSGFSIGGVIGPLIGACVALLIGLAYRALQREAQEREELLAELLRTRKQLAQTEREQGALAERARLARDIHDTVAQGLSSIHMLLNAAERDRSEQGLTYITLAKETAQESLTETRNIIDELTPKELDRGLAGALRRLATDQAARTGIDITVDAHEGEMPMQLQTALLRIAQGALSNATRHSNAEHIRVGLELAEISVPTFDSDKGEHEAGSGRSLHSATLTVADDGRGFDIDTIEQSAQSTDSFGLNAIRQRVEQLDGTLAIDSEPGQGTVLSTTVSWDGKDNQ